MICTNGPPESWQPLPLQSLRCRHRTVAPNGHKRSVYGGYADLSRVPHVDSSSTSCSISFLVDPVDPGDPSEGAARTTKVRQFVDLVLDIVSRRSSRTTRDDRSSISCSISRETRAISFYRLALAPSLFDLGSSARREYHNRSSSRASPRRRRAAAHHTSAGLRREHHDRSRSACHDACWQGRKLPLAPSPAPFTRDGASASFAPFLGPDPRFRSNRFLGSRIAVRS